MKLFSRDSTDDSDEDFEDLDLPTKEDLDESFFVSSDVPEPSSHPMEQKDYGIEDAIELMQSLPRDNDELVVTVVHKTLQSMDIAVADIIGDADQKEHRIREKYKALEQEVKELQASIEKRNQEMETLTSDLKQTVDVKKRLNLALELENQRRAPAKVTTPQNREETSEVVGQSDTSQATAGDA